MEISLKEYIEFRDANIKRYYPDVLANAKEFKALAAIITPELNKIISAITKNTLNLFITELDKDGCKRWEEMLLIYPKINATLDDRRFAILSMMLSSLPYTFRKLEQILDGLCGKDGYKIIDNFKDYELKVLVSLGSKNQRNAVQSMTRFLIPANLVLIVDLLYNRHIDLEIYTHEYMQRWTHHDLKEEVLTK